MEMRARHKVELSVYEWHLLLDELKHLLCIVNRDNTNANYLWDKIAKQLNDECGIKDKPEEE